MQNRVNFTCYISIIGSPPFAGEGVGYQLFFIKIQKDALSFYNI